MSMQVKILRVLEESEVQPIGAARPRKINARVICATNRNLEEMVKAGTFRQDLYFRINVISIKIPSLRERKADVPLLIRHALRMYGEENGVPSKSIAAEALNYLMNYPWPGNVRELINVVYNLSIFVEGPRIDLSDIVSRPELFHKAEEQLEAKALPADDPILHLSEKIDQGLLTLSDAKHEFEKLQILRALRMCSGKITTASNLLQMPRPQVSRLIKKYGIKEEDEYLNDFN
jgi:DNA-binding NtrC family response regulator